MANRTFYDNNKTINTTKVAKIIKSEHRIIFCAGSFYLYENGVYKFLVKIEIERWVKDLIKADFTGNRADGVIRSLQTDCYEDSNKLNNTNLLNLKNGLLDLDKLILHPHRQDVISTVQLAVNYDSGAICPQWIKIINEIFQDDQAKVEILQEFFGLCLTKETKYRKALFCIGEGKNGKTTVLEILEKIISRENVSAVPLEMFDNRHYLANLHGKLANITIETNAKSEIYDSNFKAITSGDLMEADRKFGHPFTFHPFCKVVVATNNLPRVDDKTDAFYDRLLILPFTRAFQEHEQDKELKYKLSHELDGILLWAIEGLRRLQARGYFNETAEMQAEKAEYRKDNNNVLVFVEETCELGGQTVTKSDLYKAYKDWCDTSGHRPLSMIKFGKELSKQYKGQIDEDRTSSTHYWIGISLNC
jgi:putative DNA primase/helicase